MINKEIKFKLEISCFSKLKQDSPLSVTGTNSINYLSYRSLSSVEMAVE